MLFGLVLILYWRKHGTRVNDFDSRLKEKVRGWKERRNVEYTPYEEIKDEPKVPRDDGEYNRQRAQKEHDVDALLDKVSKSGYGSLTDEEKEFLFKNSK